MAAVGVHPSVLVIEDGQAEEALERRLSNFGYQVFTGGRDEALSLVDMVDPDLVLLDIASPGDGDCDTLANLLSRTEAPVVMRSYHASEADRVRALLAGADDYLGEEVSPAEVTARVAAILRRSPTKPDDVFSDAVVRIGPIGDVLVRGERVLLTPIEFRLLVALAENRGRVLSPERLGHLVWGQLSVSAAENARLYVGYLRAKIEIDPSRPQLIETVRGQGYRYRGSRGVPATARHGS